MFKKKPHKCPWVDLSISNRKLADDYAKTIKDIVALHKKNKRDECQICVRHWPCLTVQIIMVSKENNNEA